MPRIRVFVAKSGFNVESFIDDRKRRASDVEPALKKGGIMMLGSVNRNFQSGGRPSTWRRLSLGYALRKFAAGYGTKTLVRTGQLKRSIVYRTTKNELIMGTSVPYARVHQYGGGNGIPKRPYIVFQREDVKNLNKLVLEHMTGRRAS